MARSVLALWTCAVRSYAADVCNWEARDAPVLAPKANRAAIIGKECAEDADGMWACPSSATGASVPASEFGALGPRGLIVSGGTLYAVDEMNHRVTKTVLTTALDALGTGSTVVAGETGAPSFSGVLTKLAYPRDIAIASDGSILVTDAGNGRVVRVEQVAAGQDLPAAVVIAGGNGPGAEYDQFAANPVGLAYDSGDDSVYVADTMNHRVLKFACSTSTGTLVCSTTGSLVAGKCTGDAGAVSCTAGSGLDELNQPKGIAVRAGTVYIADEENHRVLKCSSPSTCTVIAGGNGEGDGENQLTEPSGVFVTSSGTVYIADTQNHRIVKLSGSVVTIVVPDVCIKENAPHVNCAGHSGPKQLWAPSDVNVVGDLIYISDSKNRRIVVYCESVAPESKITSHAAAAWSGAWLVLGLVSTMLGGPSLF